jgi:hypothetical protein
MMQIIGADGSVMRHHDISPLNIGEAVGNNSTTAKTLASELHRVILIGSSSRGGSSITAEFLRQRDDLLHLRAEINPFLKQLGLVFPQTNTGSDRLIKSQRSTEQQLWQLLTQEIGNYHRGPMKDEDWDIFSNDVYRRLQLQWPTEKFSLDTVFSLIQKTRNILEMNTNWSTEIFEPVDFHCLFLSLLREDYPNVDPRWYDLPEQDILKYFSELPPLKPLIEITEEPPFVLIAPWKLATEEDLRTKPLIIKTPSNAYRIPFFRSFFKNQKLDLLHLKREAAQAINGLIDGWKYPRGFHSHPMKDFSIQTTPMLFWKYDLPPNWEKFQGSSLAEICSFQWYSAHHWILKEKYLFDSTHSIWFQQVLDDDLTSLERLWNWFDVDPTFPMQPIHTLPPTMATARPRQFRWFDNRQIIIPTIQKPKIKTMMEKLNEE